MPDIAKRQWRESLTGQQFGRLTVLSEEAATTHRRWSCRCTCGTVKVVGQTALKSGATQSCGCLRSERRQADTVHGHAHRGDMSRTYRIWAGMISRCETPSSSAYPRYGALGITVCERWHDFSLFLADMGECPPGLTIDREDGTLGYAPGNCRWATRKVQSQNRSMAHWITFNGETLSLTQWAERLNIGVPTLLERLAKWPRDRALTEAKNG